MGMLLGALDIGTSTSRLYAAEIIDRRLEVVACVSVTTIGVRKGVIRNIDAVVGVVTSLQRKMSAEYKIDLYDVVVNFSSMGLQMCHRTGHKTIPLDYEITELDVLDAEENSIADESPDAPDVVVQRFRQKYEVDGHPVNTPLGMTGTELVANVLELRASRLSYEAVKTVVHRAGMRLLDVFFSGVAAMEAVLDNKARDDGAIVLDFGAGIVDYVVICHGVIAKAGTLAVGGSHLTNDLALAFSIPQKMAEELKRSHGAAVLQPERAKERYALEPSQYGIPRHLSVHAIQTVTTERVDETLRLIHDVLIEENVLHLIHGGVYLTGGTAALPGIVERTAQIFACPCRIGVPVGIELPEELRNAPYLHATGVGLLKYRGKLLSQSVSKPSIFSRLLTFFKH